LSPSTTTPSNHVDDPAASDEPIAALRGAAVRVDTRGAGRALGVVAFVALAALVVALFVAAASKNSQLAALRAHPLPVVATVTSCLGELGGSGSNATGYTCEGTYVVAGHHYEVTLPGNALLARGSAVREVVAASDPGLLASPSALASQAPSWRVYRLPTALLALLAALALVVVRRSRRPDQGRVLEPFGV
jgi:hypothetical protein